jgi:UDP-glucuronate 4-epimerase
MGRPDMAYFNFTEKYFKEEPIYIFNNGDHENDMYRDFTYIDDIIEGIVRLISNPPINEVPQHKIFNIGNSNPEKLMLFIKTLEKCLGNALRREVEFKKIYEPIKPGDVYGTYASTELLENVIGFRPKTNIEDGLQQFANWYVDYYKVK